MTVSLVFFVVIHTRKLSSVMFYLWHSSFCTCVVYRDRSDSSHKAKRSVTSEERSGSVSSPSRGTSPSARKKSTSPKALSHKAPALASPPRRLAHAHYASFITVEFNQRIQDNNHTLSLQVSLSSTPPAHPHASPAPLPLIPLGFLCSATLSVSASASLLLSSLPPEHSSPGLRPLPSELPALPIASCLPRSVLAPPPI